MKMASIRLCIWALDPFWWNCLGKIGRYGLVRGSVSEVSKTWVISLYFLAYCLQIKRDAPKKKWEKKSRGHVAIILWSHKRTDFFFLKNLSSQQFLLPYLHCFIMDINPWKPETQLNSFYYNLLWSWCSITTIDK